MIEHLVAHLQSLLSTTGLTLGTGRPCSLRLPDGGVLEMRYVAEAAALCLAIPMGRLARVSREEALVHLMRHNLYLADGGAPHFALAPCDDQVYLCRTVLAACTDIERCGREVQRLIDAAPLVRQGLLAHGVLSD